jgi:hypothetical protein
MEIERQLLEDRSVNYVQALISTEQDCDPSIGEYSLSIIGFIGSLDLSSVGGVDDISLIKEAIENHIDFTRLPNEGWTEILLKESGEWEDVFWHKYYEIERIVKNES